MCPIRSRSQTRFIGRKKELNELKLLLKKKSASLVVVQGRRRIGKSRLIREFGKDLPFYHFSGIPPSSQMTAQSQRDEFSRQLSLATGLPEVQADDWSKLFILLAKATQQTRAILLLDEISWMGSKDPDFLGKLKNAWDLYFKENPNLILILCGSVSVWIEENILNSTGFVGRISLVLTLKELSLPECNEFLNHLGTHASPYEKFKLLAVTGGVPRYLEEIQPGLTAEENIRRLCFQKSGVLFREFEDIFSDLFSKRSNQYKKICQILAEGSLELTEISKKLQKAKSGHLSEHLENLIKSGFVSRDYTWDLKTGIESKLSHYRLSDNYIRFYLRSIEKNRGKIQSDHFQDRSISSLPAWDSIMGLQFENLILNGRSLIFEKLRIHSQDIQSDNPYFQKKTTRTPGCQIDYLIHTRFNTLFVCEVKFSKNEIKANILSEMKQKIESLKVPRGYSKWSVLICVNGVHESVIESGYFSEIIDWAEFLT